MLGPFCIQGTIWIPIWWEQICNGCSNLLRSKVLIEYTSHWVRIHWQTYKTLAVSYISFYHIFRNHHLCHMLIGLKWFFNIDIFTCWVICRNASSGFAKRQSKASCQIYGSIHLLVWMSVHGLLAKFECVKPSQVKCGWNQTIVVCISAKKNECKRLLWRQVQKIRRRCSERSPWPKRHMFALYYP